MKRNEKRIRFFKSEKKSLCEFVEKIGITVCALLAPGYACLMLILKQPIEWGVIGFILAMGVFLLLYATVFRKYTENTKENRDAVKKIIKRTVIKGLIDKDF